jgi:uncharacterized protein
MDRFVLITGASTGIGAALAREFAAQGFSLVITGRDGDALANLASSLGEDVVVRMVTADLSTPVGVDDLIATVNSMAIEIEILVNNAGVTLYGELRHQQENDVQSMLALNILAVTQLTQEYLKGMLSRDCGRILNVASVAAFQPVPGMAAYAATKAFVLSLSEALSEELRGTGVSVTALCPGLTSTGSTAHLTDSFPDMLVSTPDDVAAEGVSALLAGDAVCVPGAPNKAAVMMSRLQPRAVVRRVGGLFSRLGL